MFFKTGDGVHSERTNASRPVTPTLPSRWTANRRVVGRERERVDAGRVAPLEASAPAGGEIGEDAEAGLAVVIEGDRLAVRRDDDGGELARGPADRRRRGEIAAGDRSRLRPAGPAVGPW